MKVIIAGSRGIRDFSAVEAAVKASGFEITEVVSGGARGVDKMGESWARLSGVPIKRFLANWFDLGKRAGPVRNEQMAEYADGLIAVWDGTSSGTWHMIGVAHRLGLKVYVARV